MIHRHAKQSNKLEKKSERRTLGLREEGNEEEEAEEEGSVLGLSG